MPLKCIFVNMIQRYFAEIAFDGTNYHGWQIQKNAVSVQELLNTALSTVLREKIETLGCGRTDTGVHARQLFAHFDMVKNGALERDKDTLHGVNAILPSDIAVKRFVKVDHKAHARFDAISRSYEYYIHFYKDPFKTKYSFLHRENLDVEMMNRASRLIMEHEDFSCFSKTGTGVKTNICKVTEMKWERVDGGLTFFISADRFLRNMVRAIVGTLIEVGEGKLDLKGVKDVIESKNRSHAGMSVPACGLYLTKVVYPYL